MNNISILLVDDDDIANFISEKVLRTLGFDSIRAVTDVKQAYERLEQKCPDLVFLDINMPVMDGFSFLSRAAKELLCKHMNVVILTSSNRQKDKDKASQFINVVDYIEKPLNQDKVQQALAKVNYKYYAQ